MQKNYYPSLGKKEFEQLCSDARLIETHRFGPKVYIHEEKQQVVKIFYQRKRLFSWPQFSTPRKGFNGFVKNAKQLLERNIIAPQILAIHSFETPKATAKIVVYQKIPGEDLYSCLKKTDLLLQKKCIEYLATLHAKGIFFRGIHLGNILKQDSGNFAVIDIEDCYFYSHPLPLSIRASNIAHILNREKDANILPLFHLFMEIYNATAHLTPLQKKILIYWVKYLITIQKFHA